MLDRWEYESVSLPEVEMARVMLKVPVISMEGKSYTVKVPLVVDLEDLAPISEILTRNGYHYTVEPVEVVVE